MGDEMRTQIFVVRSLHFQLTDYIFVAGCILKDCLTMYMDLLVDTSGLSIALVVLVEFLSFWILLVADGLQELDNVFLGRFSGSHNAAISYSTF
jgi:hypothetical protein